MVKNKLRPMHNLKWCIVASALVPTCNENECYIKRHSDAPPNSCCKCGILHLLISVENFVVLILLN